MKTTLTLVILMFSLLILFPSQAAAQQRDKTIGSSAPQSGVKTKVPIEIANESASVGTPPKILATSSGIIYDVNALNGTTGNARKPQDGVGSVKEFIGMAFTSNDTLYGLTGAYEQNPSWKTHLFTVYPNGPYSTLGIGPSLSLNGNIFQCIEGDLAFDKMSPGYLYATCNDGGGWKLITVKLSNGFVTLKGQLPTAAGPYGNPEFTALAFNPGGELYALDTYNKKLYKLNKNDAMMIGPPVTLTGPLPIPSTRGSMGFSDDGGLYASFGGKLVTIGISNGGVGVIGNSGSFSGLAVSGGSGPIRHN